jgi:hypothetical protein
MRLRFAVLASLATFAVAAAGPGVAAAAPHHNRGLTINATPNPIVTGESVLIYGQLNGANHAGQTIYLYHRINPQTRFTVIGHTTTGSNGFYAFTREEGVVTTNRSWFVRGPKGTHSRTIHERVAAAITLAASSATGDTRTPITFTGHVDPSGVHVGDRIYLQQQSSAGGDDWRTFKSGVLDASGNYSIAYRFLVAGQHDVRALIRHDVFNYAAASDPTTVSIQQAQNATFTINTSAPVIDDNTPATITGVLYPTAGGTVGLPGVMVTLFARQDGTQFEPVGQATTGTDGRYLFTVTPQHNTIYQVRTALAPPPIRHTAVLYEGVRDLVTLNASSTTSQVGQSVTFTGTVQPDKTGHVIYLQMQGKNGDWNTVEIRHVNASSAYEFKWTFGYPGTHTFRTLVTGGPENVSGHSPAVAVTVTLPSVSTLAPTP